MIFKEEFKSYIWFLVYQNINTFLHKKWPLHRDIRNFLLLTTVKPGIEKVIKVKRERCMLQIKCP